MKLIFIPQPPRIHTQKWFLGLDVMRVDLDFDNCITNVVTDGGVVGNV